MLEGNFGELGSKQIVLDAGFDETTDHPLEVRAVFDQKNGHWTHLATLACRCQMNDFEEPQNPHPGHPMPRQEWVITLHHKAENSHQYHRTEVRFRLLGGVLRPLIEFESMHVVCPQGYSDGPQCKVVETDLEPSQLITADKGQVSGFVLVSRSGNEPARDMTVMRLYNTTCVPYSWDEAAFAYLPSTLTPFSCGTPHKSQKNIVAKPAQSAIR